MISRLKKRLVNKHNVALLSVIFVIAGIAYFLMSDYRGTALGEGESGFTKSTVDSHSAHTSLKEVTETEEYISVDEFKAYVESGTANNTYTWSAEGNILLTANIQSVEHMIMLSNLAPSVYENASISLNATDAVDSFDFTKEVEYKSQKYIMKRLGSAKNPFKGTFNTKSKDIKLNKALFNYLGDAEIDNISFVRTEDNIASALLAEYYSGTNKNYSVTVKKGWSTETKADTSYSYSGVIGTLCANSSLTLNVTDEAGSCVVSSNDAGIFCNTLGANSSLTIGGNTGAAARCVTALSGNAGAYVGKIGENAMLTIGDGINQSVSLVYGNNAGGIVGYMESGARLSVASGANLSVTCGAKSTSTAAETGAGGIAGYSENAIFDITGSISVTGSYIEGKNSGGYIGYCKVDASSSDSATRSFTLAENNGFKVTNTDINSSNSGGMFGKLEFKGGSEGKGQIQISQTPGSVMIDTSNTQGTGSYGGVIGAYVSAGSLTDTLSISGVSANSKKADNALGNYGGIVAKIEGKNTTNTTNYAYVSVQDVSVNMANVDSTKYVTATNMGGIAACMTQGHFLDISGASVTANNYGGTIAGGLVGESKSGVIKLAGTTYMTYAVPGEVSEKKGDNKNRHELSKWIGQLVGKRNDTLVFADGWTFNRFAGDNSAAKVSDIGDWGSVLRFDANSILSQDNNNHTVKFNTLQVSENSVNVNSLAEFVLLASYIQYKANGDTVYGALGFEGNASGEALLADTINISCDISLEGTGITGLLRDDGSQTFKGSIEGSNNPTIKLATGEEYPSVEGRDNNGQIYNHGYLGLIAKTEDVTVKNINIDGKINFDIVNNGINVYNGSLISYVSAGKTVTLENVKVSADLGYNDREYNNNTNSLPDIFTGGIIGYAGSATKLNLSKCSWEGNIDVKTKCSRFYIGGYIGYIASGKSSLSIKGCSLLGTISQNKSDAYGIDTLNSLAGGIVSVMGSNDDNAATMVIDGLDIRGLNVTTSVKSDNTNRMSSGGFIAHTLHNVDVTVKGLVVAGSSLTVNVENNKNNGASFGGLVHHASGYWKISKNASRPGIKFTKGENNSVNTFTGVCAKNVTSALLICTGDDNVLKNYDSPYDSNNYYYEKNKALYLEIGDGAYVIEEDSVNVNLTSTSGNPGYFDDIVGVTKSNYGNGVVSIATEGNANIDTNNTWKNKCKVAINNAEASNAYKNPYSRYYYNLDTIRVDDTIGTTLNSGKAVLLWSLTQYAEDNIKRYFDKNFSGDISGTIDFTGLSYYPVTPLANVTIDNATIKYASQNITETNDYASRHYLMHAGLFLNINESLTVNGLTLQGTIGHIAAPSETIDLGISNNATEGSGALVCGNISGSNNNNVSVLLKSITLDGVKVYNIADSIYSPLLINKVGSYSKISLNNKDTTDNYALKTTDQYNDDNNRTSTIAATSLIGIVGNENSGEQIRIEFIGQVVLDARKPGSTNNKSNVYNTYHTIFKNATLLQAFYYTNASSCVGTYNFKSSDTCTYGVEISNENSGRNPGKQKWYYDTNNDDSHTVKDSSHGNTAWDGFSLGTSSDNGAGYLRYVAVAENGTNMRELDINIKPVNLSTGCGTYGDPFIINDGAQLSVLATLIETGIPQAGFVMCIDGGLIENSTVKPFSNSSHLASGNYGSHRYYTYDSDAKWYQSETPDGEKTVDSSIDHSVIQKYFSNAYYVIKNDITLDKDFIGLGSDTQSFCGVIVGKKDDSTSPFITLSNVADTTRTQFGGIVRYASGCVIKDIQVGFDTTENTENTENTGIKMNASGIKTTTDNNIGVSDWRFFGGVIGYAIGGDNIIDNVKIDYGDKVKVDGNDNKMKLINVGGYVGLVGGVKANAGGGVIFKNMSSDAHGGLSKVNGEDISQTENYYWNPYVGRVLDGFVCSESTDLENTNRNYKIRSLTNTDLVDLTIDNNEYTIKIGSAQQLWVLSAIVNSGAGAWVTGGFHAEVKGYSTCKVRAGDYSGVGTNINVPDDEKYLGGIRYEEKKATYLSSKYTNNKDYISALCSKAVNINITADIDMSKYESGFQGIGQQYASYNVTDDKVKKCTLNMASFDGGGHTITLDMSKNEYEKDLAHCLRMGMINSCISTSSGKEYKNCTIKGNVKLNNNGFKDATTYQGMFIAAFSYGSKNSITISNIKVVGLENTEKKIEGARNIGGLIGRNDYVSIAFKECSVNDLGLYLNINQKDNNVGGIIGYSNKGINASGITVSGLDMTVKTGVSGGGAGGLAGCVKGDAQNNEPQNKISKCTISNIDAFSHIDIAGCVGQIQSSVTVADVSIDNIALATNKSSSVGGIFGWLNKKGIYENCAVSNSYFLGTSTDNNSSNSNMGGIVAVPDANNQTFMSCSVINCKIIGAKKDTAYNDVGALAGEIIKIANVKAYDILLRDNMVGIIKDSNIVNDPNDSKSISINEVRNCGADNIGLEGSDGNIVPYNEITKTTNLKTGLRQGRFIGHVSGKSSNISLVAVQSKGSFQPMEDIGRVDTYSEDSTNIIYANYANNANNNVTAPALGVTPSMEFKQMIGTKYGDGVGLSCGDLSGSTGNPTVPQQLYKDVSDGISDSYRSGYQNITDISNLKTDNLKIYSDLEVNTESNKDMPKDFPVLLIDNPAIADQQIREYISLLTNSKVEKGYSLNNAVITTWKWNENDKSFSALDNSTIIYNNNKFYVRAGDYDNTKDKFTIIDVKIQNPTDTNTNEYFVLSIPVYVKKIMDFKFYAAAMSGTMYNSAAYDSLDTAVLTNYGEDITVRLTYVYERTKDEWKNLLDAGESFCYALDNKAVWLGKDLPNDTELILVDPQQQGRVDYYCTAKDNVDNNGKLLFTKFAEWKDVYVCDMLNPTATEYTAETQEGESPILYVIEDSDKAALRCQNSDGTYTYYRQKNADDGDKKTYTIEINPDLNEAGYIVQTYYLTMRLPKLSGSPSQSLINNIVSFDEKSIDNTHIATQKNNLIKNGEYIFAANTNENKSTAENRYIVSNFFEQSLTAYSQSESVLMLRNDNTAELVLQLNDAIDLKEATTFQNYTTDKSKLFHRFDMQLTKRGDTNTPVNIVGGTKYTINYTVKNASDEKITSTLITGEVPYDTPSFSFDYVENEQDNIISWFKDQRNANEKVTISATLTLTYDEKTLYEQFPENDNNNTHGLEFSFNSRLSMDKKSLSTTAMNKKASVSPYFKRQAFELANLYYYAYEMKGFERSGDVSRLGINAFNSDDYHELTGNPWLVTSCGQYDVTSLSNVDAAKKIKCTLTLYKKNESGQYEKVSVPTEEGKTYLSDVTIRGKKIESFGNTCTLTQELTEDELANYHSLPIDIDVSFNISSGDKLPELYYSNYKVVLSADLLDADGNSLKAETNDYIIYTNAKINPAIQSVSNP